MSDKRKKRYYWLKLKEDFFEEDTIQWLEEQEYGKEYCLIYLKLCLKSLKMDGCLVRSVGSKFIPYDAQSLAKITNSPVDTVIVALELFKNIGLVEMMDDGSFFISQLNELVGTETEAAREKRIERNRKNATLSQECRKNVAQSIENRVKSIEYRDNNGGGGKSSQEDSLENIFDYLEKNGFGSPYGNTMGENIIEWVNDFRKAGAEEKDIYPLFKYAIDIAIKNNSRMWKYVESILRRYESKRILSVNQAKGDEENFRNNKRTNAPKSHVPKFETNSEVEF